MSSIECPHCGGLVRLIKAETEAERESHIKVWPARMETKASGVAHLRTLIVCGEPGPEQFIPIVDPEEEG